jgi:hypothetical protein
MEPCRRKLPREVGTASQLVTDKRGEGIKDLRVFRFA